MERRRVFWHIGPDDPAMSFLADALCKAKLPSGFVAGADATVAAAVTVALNDAHDGVAQLSPTIRDAWASVEDRVWHRRGTTLLSTPGVANCPQMGSDLALDGLKGTDLHLVLLVRPMQARVRASWEQALAHGSTTSLERFAQLAIDPNSKIGDAFAKSNDPDAIRQHWVQGRHPAKVHVVEVPEDPAAIFHAFLDLAGAARVPFPADTEIPGELSTPAGDLLRKINAALDDPEPHTSEVAHELMLAGSTVDPAADALAAATAEIARLREQVDELERERVRLDHLRRKHKKRAKALRRKKDVGAA